MSTSAWTRIRAGLSATIVVAATAAGVTIGLGGATVSPVSITSASGPTSSTAVAPTVATTDGSARGVHHHR